MNRLLRRHDTPELSPRRITSHSFQRGGAQLAYGNDILADQWILDRGGWNMCTAKKGFMYLYNTSHEDRKVYGVLSGWAPDEKTRSVNTAALGSSTRTGLERLQALVFDSCISHASRSLNVGDTVLAVLRDKITFMRIWQISHNCGPRLCDCHLTFEFAMEHTIALLSKYTLFSFLPFFLAHSAFRPSHCAYSPEPKR